MGHRIQNDEQLAVTVADNETLETSGLLFDAPFTQGDVPWPKERFVFIFPKHIEDKLYLFDAWGIRWAQKFTGPFMYSWNVFITALTTVEMMVVAPFVLFILGQDGLATEFTYLALMTTLFSQIPKRFIFRPRPYMVGRAKQMREDKTSSFPSRAVMLSVVIAFCIEYAVDYYDNDRYVVHGWMFALVIGFACLAAFARVNLGVHYPSDCIVGVVQGALVCLTGTLLYRTDVIGCRSCATGACYAMPGSKEDLTVVGYSGLNIPLIIGFSVAALVITILSILPPLRFWVKCHHIYGMLFPCILFQLTFICPPYTSGNYSLPKPHRAITVGSVFFALGFAALGTVLGMLTRKKVKINVIAFVLIYLLIFFSMGVWRLHTL